ncbi:ABC transporter substrate-binding protein [Alcaligenaceae bacterium CGII-47]|nr:ABC transporter substrate-binding protein [Alcaligenaceae bacterium CGII-47]
MMRSIYLAVPVSAVLLAAAPAQSQTVTAVMQSGLRLLDPAITTVSMTTYHGYMIYDTLVSLDSNYKVQPQMADWKESADGKTYTFTLRDGLKWHDGAKVTSEDCIASIKRWAEQDKMGQMLMPMVSEMKALDDKNFEIILKEPTPLVLQGLSKIGGPVPVMMPKRMAQTPSTEAVKEHIGSGPFKFIASEFRPNTKVVYEKNTDYVPRSEPSSWTAGGKVVNVDRVEWITMPDQMTAVNALLNEEIDYVEVMPFDLLPMVEKSKDVQLALIGKLGYQTVYRFNFTHPPFDNKLLRQAAMYAVGQEDVMKAVVGDPKYYQTCAAVFGCGGPFEYTTGTEWIVKPDIEKAQALLKEAKYDGAPVVLLHATDNPNLSAQPIVIAQALRKAGFKVEMQSMDWQTLASRRTSNKSVGEGGWSMFVTNWPLTDMLDPLRYPAVAANGARAWFGWPDNPQIEQFREQFARTGDLAEQKALTQKIQETVLDEGVIVPLGQYQVPSAYSKKLTDVIEAPVALFWGAKKAK